ITARMLLGQTSGLSARSSRTGWDSNDGAGASLQINAKRLGAVPLDREPGATFEYADANYDVLGAVVEAASGENFDAYIRDHVLAPLGMAHTYVDLSSARAAGLTEGYYRWFGLWNATMDMPYARSAVPSSYVVSTARDQATLLAARIDEQPANRAIDAALAASLEPLARVDQYSTYASGWFVHPFWPSQPPGSTGTEPGVPVMYQHSGTAITYRSYLAFSPAAHFGIVVLANRDDEVTPSGFDIFTDQLTRTALGTALPPYRPEEDFIRHYSTAVLVGLPLLQLATVLLVARARRRARFVVAAATAVLVAGASLSLLLAYVPSQSTLPILATWQTLPDIAIVTATSIAMALLLVGVLTLHRRQQRLDQHPARMPAAASDP
ncbi:MAG: serine hydrolase domain-containing protein, partial [Pedococcus sp.]